MLNWAISNDVIEANPTQGLKMPAPLVQRDRALDDGELRLFWRACDKLGWPFGPLFKLLLLTAQRRDELAHAVWSEIDLDKGLWTLPRERVKNDKAHVVHLSALAVEIFEALPKVHDRLVFTTNGERTVSGFGRARERILTYIVDAHAEQMGNGREDQAFTLHDLPHRGDRWPGSGSLIMSSTDPQSYRGQDQRRGADLQSVCLPRRAQGRDGGLVAHVEA
jgi:integrase